MPREKITITDEFKAAVERYRQAHHLKSWSQALLELAAKQLGYESKPYPSWGGKR